MPIGSSLRITLSQPAHAVNPRSDDALHPICPASLKRQASRPRASAYNLRTVAQFLVVADLPALPSSAAGASAEMPCIPPTRSRAFVRGVFPGGEAQVGGRVRKALEFGQGECREQRNSPDVVNAQHDWFEAWRTRH